MLYHYGGKELSLLCNSLCFTDFLYKEWTEETQIHEGINLYGMRMTGVNEKYKQLFYEVMYFALLPMRLMEPILLCTWTQACITNHCSAAI